MWLRVDGVLLRGKKFYQLKSWKEGDEWMRSCKEFIQPSKNFK